MKFEIDGTTYLFTAGDLFVEGGNTLLANWPGRWTWLECCADDDDARAAAAEWESQR